MEEDLFATPEEAALAGMSDVSSEFVRVAKVTYSRDGSQATVELATNEEPVLHSYYVLCHRDAQGLWSEGISSSR
jgi:hypothetical protein